MALAYVENPTNCTFEGQDSDEKILLLVRAHLLTNVTWIVPALLIFFLPFFIASLLKLVGFQPTFIPQSFLTIFTLMNYLLVMVVLFEGFLKWYFNVNIISNEKIVDINFDSLLHKNVDLAPLNKIEEADSTVKGIIGTLFNFGDVAIQTAGAKITIYMHNVPNPSKIADLILELAEDIQKGGG